MGPAVERDGSFQRTGRNMNALELTIFGLVGMLLTATGLTVNASPIYFATPSGGMGVPLEMALSESEQPVHAQFGGNRHAEVREPAVASFPRAF